MGKIYKVVPLPQGAETPKDMKAALELSQATGSICVPPEQLFLTIPSGNRVRVIDER